MAQGRKASPAGGRPVAFVTGSAGRLGGAIARHLASQGWRLVLHVRRKHGGYSGPSYVEGDLSRLPTLPSLLKRALKVHGRLDLLVNSASLFTSTPRGGEPRAWDDLMRVNAAAPYFLAQAAAPFLKRTRGSVVNLLDTYADHPVLDGYPAYQASKAALHCLTRILARELAPDVRVNGVSPGAVTFPPGYPASRRRKLAQKSLLRRSGDPHDVASAVAYLAEARFTTGEVLRVDGGRFI